MSSEGEDEIKSLESLSFASRSEQDLIQADKFPLPFLPPGLPVFLHTPTLLTHVRLPGRKGGMDENGMLMENWPVNEKQHQQALLHFLSRLAVLYRCKPCPMNLLEWLFQVACSSHDQLIGEAALSNLILLLENSCDADRGSWPILVPTPYLVVQLLKTLGADVKMFKLTTEEAFLSPPGESVDVSLTSGLQSIIANVTRLFKYLSLVVRIRQDSFSTEDLQSLIIILATLSLDSGLLQHVSFLGHISHTISVLVKAIPELCWIDSISFLVTALMSLSTHHHDRLHLCKLLPSFPLRALELIQLTCQRFLCEVVFPGGSRVLSECELAFEVIKHFHSQPSSAFHYYSMYSVVWMLDMLMSSSSDLKWLSPAREREFMDMLGHLALVKIKDNADVTERAPVKDLLITMKLGMDSRKRKETQQQMNLFQYFGT